MRKAYTDIGISGLTFFDLSRYHPLEHPFLGCGDRWVHFRLWWSYWGREAVIGALFGTPWRLLFCRSHRHWMLPTLDLVSGEHGGVCAWCPVHA